MISTETEQGVEVAPEPTPRRRHQFWAAVLTLLALALTAVNVAGVDVLPRFSSAPVVPNVQVRDTQLIAQLPPTAGSGQSPFLTAAPDGSLAITDRVQRRILRFDPTGNQLSAWGPQLAPDIALLEPAGVAASADAWFVLDRAQPSVLRLDRSGAVQARIDLRPLNPYGPNGLAATPAGSLFVADTGGSRILIFGPDGQFARTLGTPGSQLGQLKQPLSLALAPDGALFVADWENARIQRWTPDLQDARTWSTTYPPLGVAVDALGRVYTPDTEHHTVDVFAPDGEHLTQLNLNLPGSSLNFPSQLGLSTDGSTLVVLGQNGLLKLVLENEPVAQTQASSRGWSLGPLAAVPIGIALGLLLGSPPVRRSISAAFATVVGQRRRAAALVSLLANLSNRRTTLSNSRRERLSPPVVAAPTAMRQVSQGVTPVRWARAEHVALGALLLALLVMRLASLGTLPDTLNPDEADNIQSALRIVYGAPPDNGFFGFDWYGEPAFSAYLFALFIKLFGVSQFAARLPTALISVATLGLFYWLLRRLLSVPTALIATLLLGSQLWYLHLSRMAWNNLHVALFTLAAMASLLLALDNLAIGRMNRAARWFGVCGVACALSLYGYPAGRVLLPSLFLVLPLALIRDRSEWKTIFGGFVSVGATAVLLFLPQARYILDHWETFNLRLSAVSILNKPEFQQSPLSVLSSQIEANLLGFWVGSFNNIPSHFPVGEPMLDPVTGLLVLVGMLASLAVPAFRRRFETWLWWSIFVVGWFFTEVITEHTPDGARGIGWMPTLLFFGALTVELLIRWGGQAPFALVSGQNQLARSIQRGAMVAVVGAVAVVVSGADLAHYVSWSNLPETRRMRDPFVAVAEFPAWSSALIQLAEQHQAGFNVGDWRSKHPVDANGVPLASPPS